MRRWSNVRKCLAVVTALSFVLAIWGFICAYAIFPAVLDSRIFNHLDLREGNAPSRNSFLSSSSYTITRKYHIFAMTQQLDFSNGEKPIMVEYGPYAFREVRHKVNLTDAATSDKKHKLRFEQKVSYVFDQNASCHGCLESDHILTTVNFPLVILVDMLKKVPLGKEYLAELDAVIRPGHPDASDTIFLLRPTMMKLLFDGKLPPSLAWFSRKHPEMMALLPEAVIKNETGFALVNVDRNRTESLGFYEISTGHNGEMRTFNKIDRFGTSVDSLDSSLDNLSWWRVEGGYKGSNHCNKLAGTDALQFHPHVKRQERLWMFQPNMCRSIYLEYQSKQSMSGGLPLYRFTYPDSALKINTKDNLGFCMEAEKAVPWSACVKESFNNKYPSDELDVSACLSDALYKGGCHDGLWSVARCMDGAPFVYSQPHFYRSPDFLRLSIEGMSEPTEEKHGTFYDIEPDTGTVVSYKRRWQMNIMMKPVPEFLYLSKVREVLLPMFWAEEIGTLNEEAVEAIKRVVTKPKKVFMILQWISVALGFLGFTVGATYFVLWK